MGRAGGVSPPASLPTHPPTEPLLCNDHPALPPLSSLPLPPPCLTHPRYALGLVNKKTGKLQVMPVEGGRVFRLEPKVTALNYGPRGEAAALPEAERRAANMRLVEQFGSQRRQRQLRQRESGAVKSEHVSAGAAVLGLIAAAGAGATQVGAPVRAYCAAGSTACGRGCACRRDAARDAAHLPAQPCTLLPSRRAAQPAAQAVLTPDHPPHQQSSQGPHLTRLPPLSLTLHDCPLFPSPYTTAPSFPHPPPPLYLTPRSLTPHPPAAAD